MNIVISGSFDCLHPGHVDFLRRAKRLGERLIVGVNSDASVKRTKGDSRPIFNESERLVMVSACRYVDVATIFTSEHELAELTRDFAPCIRVVGDDYQGHAVTGAEHAAYVIYLPRGSYSTSLIIERARNA